MPRNPKYAGNHEAVRAEWLRVFRPGTPCVRCQHPLDPRIDQMDLDHNDAGTGYLGFSHHSPCRVCGQRCNQAAGGVKGGRLRRLRRDVAKPRPPGGSRGRRW